MARIRTIKPDHWEEDEWNSVSLQAHLLWIGMKNFADDGGVIRDSAVFIRNKVFPTRDDIRTSEVSKWLNELVENSFLIPLIFENKGYYVLDFSNERIDKPQPSSIPAKIIADTLKNGISKQIQEHSGTFENTPAVEESRGIVEERNGGGFTHTREPELENSILEFFGFSEHTNFDKARTVKDFIFSLKNFLRLDFFRKQFDAYVELKSLDNGLYKHSFKNFIGDQSERFENGAWNAENWQKRLDEEKEKSSGKKEKATNGTKNQPIRGIEAAMKVAEVQMRD